MQRMGDGADVVRANAGHRIDRNGDDLVRGVVGDVFDVHAAFGRHHDGDARGLAVDQHRQIEFLVDCRAFLDVEAVHLFAVRPGLVRDERRAEEPRRFLGHVVNRFDDLHAAGFAAAAGVDLGFHHPDRPAELVGGFFGFGDAKRRNAARHRHAVIRATPLWPGIRGYSWQVQPLVIVREGGQSSIHRSTDSRSPVRRFDLR